MLLSTTVSVRLVARPLASAIVNRSNPISSRLSSRSYSSASLPTSEKVTVECRSNGSITLDIYHALPGTDSSRVILFLPTGPIVAGYASINDGAVLQGVLETSNATIVRVNYRLGDGDSYPTPVHDVLAGYDWALENLAPTADPNRRTGYRPRRARLGVCGQLVGGGLATMLALTECKMGGDRIAAAALNSPVTDWIFPNPTGAHDGEATGFRYGSPGELADSVMSAARRSRKTKTPLSSWAANVHDEQLPASLLHRARDAFFRTPANWFDPFASPVLFFRTAGVDVPPAERPNSAAQRLGTDVVDDWDPTLELGEEDEDFDQDRESHYTDVFGYPSPADSELDPTVTLSSSQPLVSRRRAHRIYPPQGSALRLPHTRISTSTNSILHDQASELAKLMQRSLVRTSLKAAGMLHPDALEERDREVAKAEAGSGAEKRVSLHVDETEGGGGLWGVPGTGWQKQVKRVGEFFKDKLK